MISRRQWLSTSAALAASSAVPFAKAAAPKNIVISSANGLIACAIGLSVREIATKRRAQLARNMSAIQSSSAPDSDVEVRRLRLARDSARLYAATADSTITAARVIESVMRSAYKMARPFRLRAARPMV